MFGELTLVLAAVSVIAESLLCASPSTGHHASKMTALSRLLWLCEQLPLIWNWSSASMARSILITLTKRVVFCGDIMTYLGYWLMRPFLTLFQNANVLLIITAGVHA